MKKLVLLLSILFIFSSCNKESVTSKRVYNAKVLSLGIDCGDTYLLQFKEGVAAIPSNSFNNIFYAVNLPDAYKIDNTEVFVKFREPTNSEIPACTSEGIAYPIIYIISAEY